MATERHPVRPVVSFDPALPRPGGVYVLRLEIEVAKALAVGRLGLCSMQPGHYLYVGSALNGLAARLTRHARSEKRLHWHIDYLLPHMRLIEAWCHVGNERIECDWARFLEKQPGLQRYHRPLGASDCDCFTHLLWAEHASDVEMAFVALNQRWPSSRHQPKLGPTVETRAS